MVRRLTADHSSCVLMRHVWLLSTVALATPIDDAVHHFIQYRVPVDDELPSLGGEDTVVMTSGHDEKYFCRLPRDSDQARILLHYFFYLINDLLCVK